MIEKFRETAEQITLHGLGFLQLKLPANQRLHIWHPELPRRECFEYSSIHDHRFGFTSYVIKGTQVNKFWKAHRLDKDELAKYQSRGLCEATHISYLHEGERTRFGNRPWVADEILFMESVGQEEINEGQKYSMNPYMYHSTACEDVVVTLMTKTFEGSRGSHSLCEIGVNPDVDFDRKQWSENQLWEVVRDAFSSSKSLAT